MAKMQDRNGTVVSVDDARVETLLARGFTAVDDKPKAPAKKAPAKKAASKRSAK
jgi:hypothetical protein